ncbi:MAG: glycosyltransferase family 9 protein [Mailhella sp.]|nr:glycosyltransferase family 9 protein [Mailhella sp.]
MNDFRILCIRSDRIGDMLVSTPVFRRLREVYPGARIDVIASPLGAVALEGNPDIDAVHIYDKRHLSSVFSLLPILFSKHDLVVSFNCRSRTVGMLAALARGKRKGALNKGVLAPWSGSEADAGHYSAVMLRELEAEFGLPHDGNPSTRIVFTIPDAVQEEVDAAYPKQPGRKRVGIFIGNIKKTGLRWPMGKFVELTDLLLRQPEPLDVWVVSGAEDVPLLEAYRDRERPGLNIFVGGKSLQQTGAFIRRCDAFVTCTSSPQHLAGAMGTPTTSITYPWSEELWTPRGPLNFSAVSEVNDDVRDIPVRQVYETLDRTLQGSLARWEEIC